MSVSWDETRPGPPPRLNLIEDLNASLRTAIDREGPVDPDEQLECVVRLINRDTTQADFSDVFDQLEMETLRLFDSQAGGRS